MINYKYPDLGRIHLTLYMCIDEGNHSNPKASAVPVPGPAALPFAPATRYVYVSPSVPSRARYGHCAVFCADARSLYVFGGCSNESNAFNDLLRFDLLNSTWSRALVAGGLHFHSLTDLI